MEKNEKQKILVVSHCFLNDAAKLKHTNELRQAEERISKRSFIKRMLAEDVEIIQLPCPEVLLYGTGRWGHAVSQLDTPFYRREAKTMLEPILLQLEEYIKHPDRFEILGIMGIDGSPSCGVSYTYDGNWGGEMEGFLSLSKHTEDLKRVSRSGIFISVLKDMLLERHLPMNIYSLESYPYKATAAAYDFLDIPKNSKRPEPVPASAKSRFALQREAMQKRDLI